MGWREDLEEAAKGKRILVVCVGNDMKGDDALGKLVHDAIATEGKLYCAEMPENYLSKMREREPQMIIIVDAVHFGSEPGSIIFAKADSLQGSGPSTHSLSFTLMGRFLPGIELCILGVQPKALEFGQPMSDEAKAGAEKVIEALDGLAG